MGHETGSQRIRPSSAGPAPENAEEAAASRTNGTVNLRDIAASARELLARTVELSYSKRDLLETLNEYRAAVYAFAAAADELSGRASVVSARER